MPNLKIHLLGFYWSDRDASFASAKRRVCSFHSSHVPASRTSSRGCKYAILRGRVKKRHFYALLSTLNAWYNAVMASPALFTIKAIKNTCPSTIQTCSNTGFPTIRGAIWSCAGLHWSNITDSDHPSMLSSKLRHH